MNFAKKIFISKFDEGNFISLKTKIIMLTIIAIIPVIVYSIGSQGYNYSNVNNYFVLQEGIVKIDNITKYASESTDIVRAYVSDPYNEENIEQYKKIKNKTLNDILKLVREKDMRFAEEITSYSSTIDGFFRTCDDIMNLANSDSVSAKTSFSRLSYSNDILVNSSNVLILKKIKIGLEEKEKAYKRISTVSFVSTIFIIIFIVIILYNLVNLLKRTTNALDKLTNLSNMVSNGNYDGINTDNDEFDRMDEVGNLVNAFNKMVSNITKANKEISSKQLTLERLNKELVEYNDNLISANNEIKTTHEKLLQSEKMASLGGMVAGVAHEINTPIGVCVLANSLQKDKLGIIKTSIDENKIRKKELDGFMKTIEETSSIISHNLTRIATLVDSFKQVAVDQSISDIRNFNVLEYIKKILFSIKPKIKNMKVELDCQEDLIINSDPSALFQIITNLLVNTTIHAYEDGKEGDIHIKFYQENNFNYLIYQDFGCGMDEIVKTKVFEPFFTTKRGFGGTGLGMNIVYNTVSTTLNGTIECNSEVGKGTRFIMKFPIVKNT